ncbi:MAG: type II toxin-antitoxin system Phd/YefM family antitoxin [Thermoanaerobaculia bacterium]|nr:type II toxin-antitoxin system Phd/YefM family antitoxin [Thermoanaerobaculia bacterium]
MAIHTTYSAARSRLAELYDRAIDNREIVVIEKRGREAVALLAISEFESLEETAHLLGSKRNAQRLKTALDRAQSRSVEPMKVDDLRRELGLGEE